MEEESDAESEPEIAAAAKDNDAELEVLARCTHSSQRRRSRLSLCPLASHDRDGCACVPQAAIAAIRANKDLPRPPYPTLPNLNSSATMAAKASAARLLVRVCGGETCTRSHRRPLDPLCAGDRRADLH